MGGWFRRAGMALFVALSSTVVTAEDFEPMIAHRNWGGWNSPLIPGADYRWLFRNVGPEPEPFTALDASTLKSPLDDVLTALWVRQLSSVPLSSLDGLTPAPISKNSMVRSRINQLLGYSVYGSDSVAEARPPSPARLGQLKSDVQYFPAAPEAKIVLAANETPVKATKPAPAPATLPTTEAPKAVEPKAVTAKEVPLPKQRLARRAKWNAILQKPAELQFAGEESLTLGELLQQIRLKHGLTVRVDLPHLVPMLGGASALQATRSQPSVPYYAAAPQQLLGESLLPSGTSPVVGTITLPPPTPTYILASGEPLPQPVVESPVSALSAPVPPSIKAEPMSPVAVPVETPSEEKSGPENMGAMMKNLTETALKSPIHTAALFDPDASATVEDVLRQALEQALPISTLLQASLSEELMLPTMPTKALEWELLVVDEGILLTSKLNANLHKETRVYSTKALEKTAGLKTAEVARVLTRTVRPWSWKNEYADAASADKPKSPQDKTKAGTKTGKSITLPKINFDLSSLISATKTTAVQQLRLVNGEGTTSTTAEIKPENVELSEEQLELLGRAWDGLFEATVTSIQVIYHADPPTGIMEVLPGMLIISQSQGAHREIAELLEQLAETGE